MNGSAVLPPGPLVVKLGGSLHDAAELRPWLTALASAPGPPRLVVPGGGPFADTVRAAQARLGFDDSTAHRMAILAMQQFGLLLHALEPRLLLAETDGELAAVPQGNAALWLPWRLIGDDRTIEPSWDVTSDSLALWLARHLDAPRLLLVKSALLPTEPATAAELAAAGIVDPAFPRRLAGYTGEVLCAGRSDSATLADLLAGRPHRLLPVRC